MIGRSRIRVGLLSELPTPYRWPVFARLLDRPEIDLRVLYCAPTEKDRDWSFPFEPDRRVRFLPVFTVSFSGRRTIHYHVNPTIFGELRRGRFDVVVLPGYAMFASQAAALWCRATGTPYVMFSETTPSEPRPGPVRVVKRGLLPVLVGGASAWLATGVLSRQYLGSYGASEDRIFRFPNMPDVDAFAEGARRAAPGRRELRRSYSAGDEPVVLYVGRLIGVKRVDLLVDAMDSLRRRGVRASLWLVGDGPERAALEARVAGLDLPRVRFFGTMATARLPEIYQAADVFVLPSDHEPWGAVVCEAMACSLPVVASDRVGAAPDYVREENGGVFPHGDATALADALARVLAESGARRAMARASFERVSGFAHGECADSFIEAVSAAHGMRRGA